MASKKGLKQGEKVLFGIFGAFVVAAVIGYAVLEYVRFNAEKPLFGTTTHYDLSEAGHRGSVIFRTSGCTACHRAMRNGTNMGLNLDGIGTKRKPEWIIAFLAKPEETYNSVTLDHGLGKEAEYVMLMPESDRLDMAAFLSGLRSDQGSASSPVPPKGESQFIDSMVETFAPDDWKDKYQDVRDRVKTEDK